MNESTKTAAFVGSAVAMLLAAVFTSYANQPKPADDYETIGQPFYADFLETNQAKSLVVTSIDPDAIAEQKFEIKQIDGLWQIPSHEGYPAEAAERLAKTSASLVGLTRDSLVGRRTSDYEKFGVVDPRNDDIVDIESVGQSITLRDANEDVLVDLIIGDRADESMNQPGADLNDEESYYFVRRADETNVYRIPLKIELSTKFSDWIEPDLLQLEATDVVQLEMNNYQIEERSSGLFGQVKELSKTQGDQISLSRKSSTDDWEIDNLKPETEKVVQDSVDAIVSVLDEMTIVDVKKKPTLDGRILLDADLNYSVTPAQAKLMSIRTQQELDALTTNQQVEFQSLQNGIMELQRDLDSKGFSFGSTGQKLELVSAGGEMQAGTSDGLRYTLHIGKAPTDTVAEIKVSGATDGSSEEEESDASDNSKAVGDSGDVDQEQAEGAGTEDVVDDDDAAPKSNSKEDAADDSNRYVLIRVAFDESLLKDPGAEPVEPTEPVKPAGYTEATDDDAEGAESEESETAVDSDGADDTDGADGNNDVQESGDGDAAPKPNNMQRNPAFVKYDQEIAAYEEAQVNYEVALSSYTEAVSEKEEQVKTGKKKAEILNGRFEKWYYIVSSKNLKTLQSSRKDLLEPVIVTTESDEAAAEARAAAKAMADRPDVSFPVVDTEGSEESAKTDGSEPVEKPSVEKPAVKTSEADEASSADSGEVEDIKMEESAEPSDEQGSATTETSESEESKSEEVKSEQSKPAEDTPSSSAATEESTGEDAESSDLDVDEDDAE